MLVGIFSPWLQMHRSKQAAGSETHSMHITTPRSKLSICTSPNTHYSDRYPGNTNTQTTGAMINTSHLFKLIKPGLPHLLHHANADQSLSRAVTFQSSPCVDACVAGFSSVQTFLWVFSSFCFRRSSPPMFITFKVHHLGPAWAHQLWRKQVKAKFIWSPFQIQHLHFNICFL